MSRPWMPFFVGDYLRNTAHLTTEQHGAYMLLIMHCWEHKKLPDTAIGRASVAKLSAARWKAVAPVVEAFFRPDGTHKRVDDELERAERLTLQRQIAGQKGGMNSAVTRARNKRFERSKPASEMQAIGSFLLKPSDSSHISKKDSLTSDSENVAPREAAENTTTSAPTARPQGSPVGKVSIAPSPQLTKIMQEKLQR